MANPEHVEILKQGVEVWNEWREENPNVRPDLAGVGVTGKRLDRVNFRNASLINANFNSSELFQADFRRANLARTNLSWTFLNEADLRGADLIKTDLSWSLVSDARFEFARIAYTTLAAMDLSKVRGLNSTVHDGPSAIDLLTIYKSKGKIPESFLRGCGVPEDFINLIPSLTFQTDQYSSCFISHSSHNQLFCKQLCTDLRSRGVDCWYFPEDAKWGRSLWGEIDKPIKIYDKLLLVCSKQSLNSPAVLRELERALQREDAEGKHILFPIRIDNYLLGKNGWEHPRKADVVAKVAGDFRNWKDTAIYHEKLDRLLRDLKASEE
ncbi:MAG: toll/interleukin-1 receptor domain-containing protein [Desulfarculaceae bacterium]|nr:toll/interleukin-1 receptor domain-containing protein [Desulfarculaceae bacterium]MCF8097927.1 toll/interleukin-1 receptor domain-containing protein [Desulfarculaceae bacterium]MCF8120829.1 toll/interleukin-1 receptor domain-containing protein [Desulfarculaceae bacterium]